MLRALLSVATLDASVVALLWCAATGFLGWHLLWRKKKPACHPPAREGFPGGERAPSSQVVIGAALEEALAKARARGRAAGASPADDTSPVPRPPGPQARQK